MTPVLPITLNSSIKNFVIANILKKTVDERMKQKQEILFINYQCEAAILPKAAALNVLR